MPAAPPKGTTLARALPEKLVTTPWVRVRPGRAFTITPA
jgi:hypothetical protein